MRDIIYRGGSYRALSDKDIENIHDTSIKILTRVGFEISFPPALELLQKHGAAVDYSKNRVYLTRESISRCIKQAPAEFTFYGLEEGKEIVLGGKRVHFGTGGKALYVLDRDRKEGLQFFRILIILAALPISWSTSIFLSFPPILTILTSTASTLMSSTMPCEAPESRSWEGFSARKGWGKL